MNNQISVHWEEESEITFRNQVGGNWLLSSTGTQLEGNSQAKTHWNLDETHSHQISHAAVGTVSRSNKLPGRAAGGPCSLTRWVAQDGAVVLRPQQAQPSSGEHPWPRAGGREAAMLCWQCVPLPVGSFGCPPAWRVHESLTDPGYPKFMLP